MTIRNLEAMLAPTSIALIGATTAGRLGRRHDCAESGGGGIRRSGLFRQPTPFQHSGATLLSRRRRAARMSPDLAVIATPPPQVPELVGELAARGCRAILVITAGLDAGLKQQMLDAARPRLVRILGPNSIGLMLPPLGLNASFAHRAALPGDLAFLSQSGALVTAVIDWASERRHWVLARRLAGRHGRRRFRRSARLSRRRHQAAAPFCFTWRR